MLIEAKRKLNRYNAKLVCGDMHKIPFKSNAFDLIVCAGALHYSKDPHAVMRELKRVLKKSGTLIVIDWSRDSLLFKIMHWYWMLRNPAYVKCYTSREMKRIIKESGLRTKSLELFNVGSFWKLFFMEIVNAESKP